MMDFLSMRKQTTIGIYEKAECGTAIISDANVGKTSHRKCTRIISIVTSNEGVDRGLHRTVMWT